MTSYSILDAAIHTYDDLYSVLGTLGPKHIWVRARKNCDPLSEATEVNKKAMGAIAPALCL